MASKKSYDAFSQVDELVSKPVLGSDGAAKWQDFRSNNSKSSISTKSVAPSLPMKRADRAVGFDSLEKERAVENEIRLSQGKASMGQGYTNFQRKRSAEEAAVKRRRKRVMDRVRPDKMTYFLPAATFEGWKHDYVFTTRHRGTGYYWDGMDSVKELLKKEENGSDNHGEEQCKYPTKEKTYDEAVSTDQTVEDKMKTKKKKKKKRKAADGKPVMVIDANSPLEQVANAIQRRNEQMRIPPMLQQQKNAEAKQWETATDPSTGKTYYFCRATGERSWTMPASMQSNSSTGTTGSRPSQEDTLSTRQDGGGGSSSSTEKPLPPGWKSARDPNTQKEYFYHASSGETRWERPTGE